MARVGSSKTRKVSKRWRDLLSLIPGYDPFAQAAGCWFDDAIAQKALDFFPECLRHIEGHLYGKPFELEPWQQAVIANLFGWQRADDAGRAVRRYREAFIEVPRKNGKTPMTAGIALYVLFCDGERGQQNYIAAGEREQAGKLFRQAKGMVLQEPELLQRCRIYGGKAEAGQSRSITLDGENSFLRVISADAAGEHGGTTHLAVIDELHVQPDRELVDVITTSFASSNRLQPLFINITTAGHDRQSICYEKYQYACKVRDNGGDRAKPGYDPAFLPVIYEAGVDDDWTDEAVWRKANPNLGVSVSLEYLRRECQRAQEIPDYENTFRQLHLDQWTEQASRWLRMKAWDECGAHRVSEEDLEGAECFGGLDMASSIDVAACVLLFRVDDAVAVVPRFWIPEDTARKRTKADGVPYETWARRGLVKATPGDWIDYATVQADIVELATRFAIKKMAFDPKECSMLAQKLIGDGINMVQFTQSFGNYNEPVKRFEQLVGEGRLWHGNHPVMNWMAGNVALDRNVAGLRLPSKKRSGEKIDGIVAAVMALSQLMLEPEPEEPSITWI